MKSEPKDRKCEKQVQLSIPEGEAILLTELLAEDVRLDRVGSFLDQVLDQGVLPQHIHSLERMTLFVLGFKSFDFIESYLEKASMLDAFPSINWGSILYAASRRSGLFENVLRVCPDIHSACFNAEKLSLPSWLILKGMAEELESLRRILPSDSWHSEKSIGVTPLMAAVSSKGDERERMKMLSWVLENIPSIPLSVRFQALEKTLETAHHECGSGIATEGFIEALLENTAQEELLSFRSKEGDTFWSLAAQGRFPWVLQKLVSIAPPGALLPDENGSTPLHAAAKALSSSLKKNSEVHRKLVENVTFLLECGCRPDARNAKGSRPMDYQVNAETRMMYERCLIRNETERDFSLKRTPRI